MKTLLLVLSCLFLLNESDAQIKAPHIIVPYSSQTVEFYPLPVSADAKELPFIISKTKNGEQFGLSFKGFPLTSPFIELLDKTGKVLRSLTVNDLLSGKSTATVKLINSKVTGSNNRSENNYEITTPQGKAILSINATATSLEAGSSPAKLLLKIALKNYTGSIASARITIPFVGVFTSKVNGFILSAARSGQALAGSINTTVERISAANKKISLVTKPESIGDEMVLLFMVLDAVNTKSEAESLVNNGAAAGTNDIVIVSTVDKESAQPLDTVTYRIHCINIGKGAVSDVVITNPISNGTRYVDGSATGDDTQITFERNQVQLPQVGDVRSISWKFTKSVNAGIEKVVQFKVVVQ